MKDLFFCRVSAQYSSRNKLQDAVQNLFLEHDAIMLQNGLKPIDLYTSLKKRVRSLNKLSARCKPLSVTYHLHDAQKGEGSIYIVDVITLTFYKVSSKLHQL